MKSVSYLILFLFLSHFCHAQVDTVFNQTDHRNLMQGHWKKFYKNGKVAYKGFFKDDKPRGEFIRYHENGVMSAKLLFSECGDTAQVTLYSPLAKEVAKGKYLRQKKHGVWDYLNTKGQKVFSEEYSEGIKHGKFKIYYPTGEVFEQVTWLNDNKNGATTQYYLNGQIKSLIFYEDGTEHGPVRLYHPDGEIRLEGKYAHGLKDDVWKFFDTNGKLLKQITYVQGIAENHDKLIEQETKELEELLRHVGKYQDPDFEDFVGGKQY